MCKNGHWPDDWHKMGTPYNSDKLNVDQRSVTNTLALPINKMLYIYLLCPHSEHQKTSVPI
jgi:hypothetical protein